MNKQIIKTSTIMNVDCMTYMRTLHDKHFDLAVCDPPYFNGPQKPGYYKGSKQRYEVGEYKNIQTWEIPGQEYFEFVGCELDPDYYNSACKRIADHAQQERLFA